MVQKIYPCEVSVVTSFFGEGDNYVYRLYEDIKKQSVDWEWIITDDFSPCEKTAKAIADVAEGDHRVKLIFQNRKREIFSDPQKYATGKFVFHIDADDRVHPSYLAHCLYWFERFPSVICILSGSEWVYEDGKYSRYVYHTRKDLEQKHNFIGRVWRNGFNFKFDEIFTKVEDIIRTNDMFLVRSIETTGDILCLPRAYIKYEMRSNSNCNIQRSEEEKEKIERCKNEFTDWYLNNSIESPYDSYFFESENDVIPFLPISWSFSGKTILYKGSDIPNYRKRKIRELYQDFEISFGEKLNSGSQDITIVDCSQNTSLRTSIGSKSNIIVVRLDDDSAIEYYTQKLNETGRGYFWIKLWDYTWFMQK